ncbi:molybdate ABC transporter substrate-binding protein [Marinomonas agarivorans]|nr:molybdate ABC transporter substrate-binding protein [Marinomonas agarivorans]
MILKGCKVVLNTFYSKLVFFFLLPLLFMNAKAETVVVSAAASLAPALTQIQTIFEQKTGHKIVLNHAASSVLARQIVYGFDSHLFLSANKKWLDYLVQYKQLAHTDTVTIHGAVPIIANQLVLAQTLRQTNNAPMLQGESISEKLQSLLQYNEPLAVGDINYVPLGEYTKQTLESVDLFADFDGKLILANNARSALAFIEKGQVNFGIIYLSDANQSNNVRIVQKIPSILHDNIHYYLAKVTTNKNSASIAVDAFYQFLQSDTALHIFLENGFLAPIFTNSVTKTQ